MAVDNDIYYMTTRRKPLHHDREEALKAGQKRYQGSECKHGHAGVRWASTGQCISCTQESRRKQTLKHEDHINRMVEIDHIHEEREMRRLEEEFYGFG